MVRRMVIVTLSVIVMFVIVSCPVSARQKLERTEDKVVSASNVKTVRFRELSHTDLEYKGIEGADRFEITFKRSVKARNMETCEELLSEIDLDIAATNDVITLRLVHPETKSAGLFDRLFKSKEWRADIEITGPKDIDLDADAEFSDVRIDTIDGRLKMNTSFSKAMILNHTGRLSAKASFCDINSKYMEGSFDVIVDFGNIDLSLTRITERSRANASFGGITIHIPRNAGAEFYLDKSFGDIDFNIDGDLVHRGDKGLHRILNNGGPRIDLDVDFGNISVRNNMSENQPAAGRPYIEDSVMPLIEKAWWQYRSGNETYMLRVEDISYEKGQKTATLVFDGHGILPFDSIEVCELPDGLSITGIDGEFFGRDLSGMRFDPPRLWLPYAGEDDIEAGDEILGSAELTECEPDPDSDSPETGMCYAMKTKGYLTYKLRLVPGVGFTAFGNDLKLVEYDLGGTKKVETEVITIEEEPPPPAFEEGKITSISIRGLRYMPKSEVEKHMDIRTGSSYTREEISDKVHSIPGKSKFINSARFTIDFEGNLKVRIHEAKLYSWDWDGDGSFSRVAGVGLGPRLTINSLVGPLSEISGGTQYHWGNKEWTYDARAEKHVFDTNRLTLGGSYRLDYESNMDWTIPDHDSYLNALLLGLETKNYYEVEGATGYISQSIGKYADMKAEYFEEEYRSVYKHTNWSIGNHRHKKENNPPLGAGSLGTITGMRYSADFFTRTSFASGRFSLSAERSYDRKSDSLPEYTRYLGSAVYTSRFPYRNMIKIRFAGGYSEDELPEQRAFRLGGINTLRGFDVGSIPEPPQGMDGFGYHGGGNRMLLANIDYYLSDDDDFGLVLFADAGNVWRKGDDVEVEDLRRNLGVGIVFGGDIFPIEDWKSREIVHALRINWAVPVGPEPHVSHWTVNFTRAY